SDEMYKIFGLLPGEKEIDLTTYLKFIHPDEQATISGLFEESKNSPESFIHQKRIFKQDGKMAWVMSRWRVSQEDNGKAVRISGITMDISELKKAEDKLKESQFLIQQITDATPNILYVFN